MQRISTLETMTSAANQLREWGIVDRALFEYCLTCFENTPYASGGDRPEGSDCSGTVCRALSFVYGKHIRVTADELYRLHFTGTETTGVIRAQFFLDSKGHAVHVAGHAGDGLYLNESRREPLRCGMFRTADELRAMYPDYRIVTRSLRREDA